jgi:hypothetical protein
MGQPLATLQELVLETFQPLEGRSLQRPEARKKDSWYFENAG